MKHAIRNAKVFLCRVGYYGLNYIWQFPLYKANMISSLKCVEEKESKYKDLTGDNYIKELAGWFKARTGEELELANPITFNQKIQWLKIYDKNPMKTILADKYLVRDWVRDRIGDKYLVPLLGVWSAFDDIDFEQLPQRFALKCNHGSGWNIIVKDKNNLDIQDAKYKIDKWMSDNFAYKAGFELHYKDITPKIIAEEYMENSGGDIYDYKFYCFDGKVEYIQFLMDRIHGLKMAYYDREWKKMWFVNNHPMIQEEVECPDNLREMIDLAETLAKGFPYVRVDFYRLNDGTIKFGEMTFSPASGTQDWKPQKANLLLGEKLNIASVERGFYEKNTYNK